MSFRAKDVSPDLDVPFVCWRLWSGLVQLWRNSVRASAKPWLSWFCCLFLLLAALPPAPPLSSVRFMWAVCICKFVSSHFLISEPESGYVHFGQLWLCLPKIIFTELPQCLYFLRAPPNEFLQILPLTFGRFQPSFLHNPAKINWRSPTF